MRYLQRIIINSVVFISCAVLFPRNVYVANIWIAILASILLSILNMTVRPILLFLSFPITFITFGLFTFVVNAAMLKMTEALIGSTYFYISSFPFAIFVAIILTLVQTIFMQQQLERYR